MKRWLLGLLAVVGVLFLIPIIFSAALARPSINDTIRRFNRDTLNPWMLKRAGRGDWYASTIETRGRKTGEIHRTPVVADSVTGGFVIPLPYGPDVDWLKNARADGHATIRHHDVNYPVDRFDVLEADEALRMLPVGHRFSFRVNGIDQFLKASIEHASRQPAEI